MAEKKPSMLGDLSGKIGDIVFKKRNGKTYISKAASNYTLSQLPAEINKRNRQRVNGKFAKQIIQNKLLKAVWDKEKAPCSTGYNKINQVNFHLCEPDRPSEKACITPGGFKLELEEITILPDRIEITPRPFDLQKKETSVKFIMIISLWNSRRKKDNQPEFLLKETALTEGQKCVFTLSQEEIKVIRKFKNKTLYLAAITLNNAHTTIRHSETLSKNFLES